MAFSKAVRDEIGVEVTNLRLEVNDLDKDIKAKQFLRAAKAERLALCEKLLDEDFLSGFTESSSTAAPKDFPPQINGVERRVTIDTDSLRASILTVLKNAPAPARPIMVSETLRKAGFPDSNKTPLNTRVNNELWRLVKAGDAVRTANGYMAKASS